MQDGYYFATTPWLIGDAPDAPRDGAGITLVEDHSGLRRGQIVRIAPEPQPQVDGFAAHDPQPDAPAPLPIILREEDRYAEDPARPDSSNVKFDGQPQTDGPAGLVAEISARQDKALARIEQIFCSAVAQLEDRVVAALAANTELNRPQSAQSDRLDATLAAIAQDGLERSDAMQVLGQTLEAVVTKVEAMPRQSEALLRDVADIRAGLTELRVQARMIEMQLFAISRGTDNPLARPMGIEPLGAMLADTYAS